MRKIVISLGGSILFQDSINTEYIKNFKKVIETFKDKFVVVIGGGKTARTYMDTLKSENIDSYHQHQIGVYTTYLNAAFVESFFTKDSKKRILIPRDYDEFDKKYKDSKITFVGGIIPGSTTDGTAAEIAQRINADLFINITNVEGLYDSDPRTNPKAKFIKEISHKDFYDKFISKIELKPGMHFIMDHKAAKICRESKIKIIILSKLEDLEKCLYNRKFMGTIIA